MNVPKLRFNEFSQDWLSDVLNNLADVRDGTHDSPKYHPNGYPLITSKNLMSSGLLDLENVNLISEEDFIKINKRSKVEIGDILFGMIGTIGNPVVIKTSDFAIKNVALIKQIDELDNRFLSYYLKSSSVLKQFEDITVGNSQKFVSLGMLRNLTVLHPLKAEQIKIANFLSAVDEKITQLTQKHELLNNYKKGVMQKIFSQELRFKDDDGGEFPEWEAKSLKELLETVIDNRGKTPPIENTGYPLIEVNAIGSRDIKFEVITKYVSHATYETWFRKHIKNGDVLFSTVGATAMCSCFSREKSKATIAQNIVGLRFKQSYSGLFMFYLLTEENNNNKFKTIEMGAVQPSIKVSQMIDLIFNVPFPKEQTKIANFLTAIDDKITATQSQLELVKQYKQGLLQQMFV